MNKEPPAAPGEEPRHENETVPQSPRVWNYWLGGKDNYAVDRSVGDEIRATTPQIVECARASREFLRRTVRYLVAEGIGQFLDIGSGFPAAGNVHEIAHEIDPEARVVYVDNDPIVLAHGRALLACAPPTTAVVQGDATDPTSIIDDAVTRRFINFDVPVGLIMMNVLGHIPDLNQARTIVRTLVDAVPSGSYLVVSDATAVIEPEQMKEAARIWNASASPPYVLRSPDEIELFFDGLALLEPRVVTCPHWRPADAEVGTPTALDQFGGVGLKQS